MPKTANAKSSKSSFASHEDQFDVANRNQVRDENKRDVSQTYWAEEQDEVESSIPLKRRMELLAQHGDFSLAYSTAVQPCLSYFGDENGFIAYRQRWGFSFTLGDIIAPKERHDSLLDEFLTAHPGTTFCQASRSLAERLNERGFYINEMGTDSTLDLDQYDFAGKQKEWLRYAANWSNRRDFEIVEAGFDTIVPEVVEKVSEAWRKTRTVKRKEVRFLNRPIVMKDELDVRKFFYLSPEGEVLAFVFLDPVYREGEKVGYVTSIKRRHPEAPIYAEQAIMKFAIEKLKSEGVQELKLGLSPLAWIDDDEFKKSWITHRLFRHAFKAKWVNHYFYHLLGHADYKRRFRGREEKLYLASQRRFNPIRFVALISLCGLA